MTYKHFLTAIFTITFLLVLLPKGFAWDFLFSSKGYADRITVQARIASQEILSHLIASNERNLDDIPKEDNHFLKSNEPHLFIRLKNHGNAGAWGKLSCNIDSKYWISIDVETLGAGMSAWRYYVTPIKSIMLPDNDNSPKVTTEWLRLYSK